MQLIKAIPKDIHLLVDIPLTDLQHLDVILNNMVFNYDGSNPAHVEAKKYLEKSLSPFVTETLEDILNGN